jgi:hypothetical protein
MTASLLQEFPDPNNEIFSISQGSMEMLLSGNVILCYGSEPTLKEFNQEGEVVLTVSWGETEGVQSYRDYKAEWVGKPRTKPDVFACKAEIGMEIYMSWNGATEHKTWTFFGGTGNGSLSAVASVGKTGFETMAVTTQVFGFVKVEASVEGIQSGGWDTVSALEEC